MIRLLSATAFALAAISLSACRQQTPDAPPSVHLDQDMCAQCGMIVSDERFADATIIEDELGRPKTLFFDDLNCMANHETTNPDLTILRRWVHDHAALAWLPAEDAVYLYSQDFHTPMASHVAAFKTQSDAEALQREVGGEIYTFAAIMARLSPSAEKPGFTPPEGDETKKAP